MDWNSLKDLLQFCKKNNILRLYDTAYNNLQFKGRRDLKNWFIDELIIVGIFSKAFNLHSFRIGFAVSKDKNCIKKLVDFNSQNIPYCSTVSQIAALYALKNKKIISNNKRVYNKRYRFVRDYLIKKGVPFIVPDSYPYIYIFTNDPEIVTSELLNQNIAVCPSTAFGDKNNAIRISLLHRSKN